jgi:hypothetical protein
LSPDLVHAISPVSGRLDCAAARLARVPAVWHVGLDTVPELYDRALGPASPGPRRRLVTRATSSAKSARRGRRN